MYIKNNSAFTLIEIIAVISIILVLIGLISPALTKARQQAKSQKAKAMIGSTEVAINMYFTDQGAYPANLNVLKNKTNNMGPYMDTNTDFNDPWGNQYRYTQSGTNNTNTFDLSSDGTDEAQNTADDIKNW
jgi:general secretion pathway protein G